MIKIEEKNDFNSFFSGDKFSFEMWKTLICDDNRDTIWIGSEDGELAKFLGK